MKKLNTLMIAMLMIYCAFLSYQISELKKDAAVIKESETINVVNKTITGFSTDLTKVIESVSPQIVRVNAFHKSSSYIGSGVIYHVSENETIVIASAQGVKGALDLSVTFNNGESTAAELIGIDELTDLAVLRTKPSFATSPIVIGNTSALSLGEWVIAVGNNKRDDFAPAISVGVISGKDRRYYNDEYRESYYELNGLVADLKVSEGLTGGVVINMQGELVGIPSSILSSDDAVIVPVEEVVDVVRLILEYKEVVRPVLGISTQKISEMTAYQKSQLGIQLDQIDGLYIHSIKRNGSCDLAQIQSGDLLLEINGTRLADYNALRSILYTFKPLDTVELTIVRGTETMKVMVTLQ